MKVITQNVFKFNLDSNYDITQSKLYQLRVALNNNEEISDEDKYLIVKCIYEQNRKFSYQVMGYEIRFGDVLKEFIVEKVIYYDDNNFGELTTHYNFNRDLAIKLLSELYLYEDEELRFVIEVNERDLISV